jgi:hypothetical protein
VRPRALPWDLLPGSLEPTTSVLHFRDFGRDEAAGVARELHRYLEQQVQGGLNPLEVAVDGAGRGFLVWVRHGELVWIACPRRPGQPYEEMRFPSLDEAQEAVRLLADVICPAPDAGQEVYFNTQHFSR